MYRHKRILIITLATIAFFVVLTAIVNASFKKDDRPNYILNLQGESAVRHTVHAFGESLKNVSLVSDDRYLKRSILKEYKPFISERLINFWLENLDYAPGMATSNPWPESIEIIDLVQTSEGYTVEGNIVLITNENFNSDIKNSGKIPIKLKLVDEGNGWKISSYEELPDQNYQKFPDDILEKKLKVRINEWTEGLDLKIMPTEVIEDSRCPVDSRCIWSGTLKVKARLLTNSRQVNSAYSVFTLNEPLIWNGYTVTLLGSDPDKSTDEPKDGYSYIFMIQK